MSGHDFWQAVLYIHLLAMASHYDLFGDSTLQLKLAVIGLTIVHRCLAWPRTRQLS